MDGFLWNGLGWATLGRTILGAATLLAAALPASAQVTWTGSPGIGAGVNVGGLGVGVGVNAGLGGPADPCGTTVGSCTCTTMRPVVNCTMERQDCVTWSDVCRTAYRQEQCTTMVPQTDYDTVCVDEGRWEMVWRPNPVTKVVPKTVMVPRTTTRTVPYTYTEKVPRYSTRMIPRRTVSYVPQTTTRYFTQPAPRPFVQPCPPLAPQIPSCVAPAAPSCGSSSGCDGAAFAPAAYGMNPYGSYYGGGLGQMLGGTLGAIGYSLGLTPVHPSQAYGGFAGYGPLTANAAGGHAAPAVAAAPTHGATHAGGVMPVSYQTASGTRGVIGFAR